MNSWVARAGELAQWSLTHNVVRDDAYLEHYVDEEGNLKKRWVTGLLTHERIVRHFLATTQEDVKRGDIISLAALVLDGSGVSSFVREVTIDIDCHDAKGNPSATHRASIAWYEEYKNLGFHPLLENSSVSSYHLRVVFSQDVEASRARALGLWMARNWKDHGLARPPEIFPTCDMLSQPGTPGSYSTPIRLFGRCPKYEYWSKIYNCSAWLDDDESVDIILNTDGDDPGIIPDDAIQYKKQLDQERKAQSDDIDQDKEHPSVAKVREALSYYPNKDLDFDDWLDVGMSLNDWDSSDVGLNLWVKWSKDSSKHVDGECKRRWDSFTPGCNNNRTIRSLFKSAVDNGWKPKPTKKKDGKKRSAADYQEKDGCLFCDGERLANFTARIMRTITKHDGINDIVRFEISAKHRSGPERKAVVDAEKYSSMAWAYTLGAEFAIEAGRDTKDLVRHAIQALSVAAGIGRVDEHTSLGWIKHDGRWLYLHAGGAIGSSGRSEAVEVTVKDALAHYRLPDQPSDPATLERAMEAHLDIWCLAKPGRRKGRGAAAVLSTLPFRAVLSAFDASVHLGGPSGNMKTSVARVAYQHFSDVTGRDSAMPMDWRISVNGLQRAMFDVRDNLLIVDDLKNEQGAKTAEIMMQSQGNLQGRLRMSPDQSLQQALSPRGSLLSTGEIDPRTQSTLGRVLLIEICAGDIDLAVLTRLQAAGDEGLFSQLMAAYVQWLAGRLDEVRSEHARLTREIRTGIGDVAGVHPRYPDTAAQLVAAYRIFLRFAVERGLTVQVSADAYVDRAQRVLLELGTDQAELQEQSKLGRRFLDLIASSLSSGRCHLANADNDLPPDDLQSACGWRWEPSRTGGDWMLPPGSKGVGFISTKDGCVYLDPTESQVVAGELARSQHNPQSFTSVGRELMQEGLVKVHVDGGKQRASENKRIRGAVRRCFWVEVASLFDASSVPTVPTIP